MDDEYWEKNFGLKPQAVSDVDVWRAAQQIVDRYPEDPEMAAAQRADSAYEQGDLFNFNLWTRITKAVSDLVQKPSASDPIN
jgi:hypothetical protein